MSYAAEVKAFFGDAVLNTVMSVYEDTSWFMLGFDRKTMYVGDGKTSIVVCRKTAKLITETAPAVRKRKKGER